MPYDGTGAAVRVVLDTNAILSALLWRGTPYRLFQAIRHKEHVRLFASAALLEELADVLHRPVPSKRLAVLGITGHQALAHYVDTIDIVTPLAVPPVVFEDKDDDQVIAAAIAADADLIVTGDGQLLDIGVHAGSRIVTPASALVILTEGIDKD